MERIDADQFSVPHLVHIPHDNEAAFSYQFQTILKIFTTHQTDQIPNDEQTNEQNGIGHLKMPLRVGRAAAEWILRLR